MCYFDIRNHFKLTMLWTNSADDKQMIFSLFFLENRSWHWDSLHEMSNSIFKEKQEKYFKMLSAEICTQHAKC